MAPFAIALHAFPASTRLPTAEIQNDSVSPFNLHDGSMRKSEQLLG
jgi:hypothetical protein